MDIKEAYMKWPKDVIHNYRVKWENGAETVYAPSQEKAEDWFEDKYPSREITQAEEQW